MAYALKNEIRNKLTEHENNYKLCNLNLISCYNGLYPASLSKLASAIFTQILSNKRYHKENSKFYDKQEDKRIYTSLSVTPITLLENLNPVKYCAEGKDASKDVGNMAKRINELDENNIFYVWKCGYPKNYMFVMERDIGIWKYYNNKAYVTPKTLKKILLSTRAMTDNMHRILQESGDKITIHDVRRSFASFISHMVDKLNPSISKEIPRFSDSDNYREYIKAVNNKVKEMDDYDGYEEDDLFIKRLPLEVQLKTKPAKRKRAKFNKEVESELLPDNENLVKPKRRRNKRVPVSGGEAKFETFKDVEPLKNAKSLFQYYKALVASQNSEAKFNDYILEVRYAAAILDKLKNNNQDVDFFRSWSLFYFESKLKGNNIKNKDKTSLKSLETTYDEYNSRYIGCGV